MTLLASVLTALLQLLSLRGMILADAYTPDDDLRRPENQEAFHEEEMFVAGQKGHCPHG